MRYPFTSIDDAKSLCSRTGTVGTSILLKNMLRSTPLRVDRSTWPPFGVSHIFRRLKGALNAVLKWHDPIDTDSKVRKGIGCMPLSITETLR